MVDVLRDLVAKIPEQNTYIGDKNLREAEASLRESSDAGDSNAVHAAMYRVALSQLELGREEDAIATFENLARSLKPSDVGKDRMGLATLAFQIGVAYLRLAETQNCCQRYTVESCVFPIQGQGVHQKPFASRTAINYFQRTLSVADPESELYLRALWLTNIAHMTVGTYPAKVPKRYLIPPEALKPHVDFPRFRNISKDVGLGTLSLAGGVVADDFNRDGRIDLLVSSWHSAENLRLFFNQTDEQFLDTTRASGLTGILGGLNMVQADFDNDGFVDVYVLRGAWLRDQGRQPNSLLHNMGDGTFQDVSFHANVAGTDYPTQTAAWGDYDNDGLIDLYVGNESSDQIDAPCQLFRNNGDGTFSDLAVSAGVTNDRYTKSVVWGDYNGDRYPDLYVSNLDEPNRLYRNNADGTFTDVAAELGVDLPKVSFPSWFWDVDNDGDLDLFVSSYDAHIDDLANSYLGKLVTSERARLYLNDGQGRFADAATEMNLVSPTAPMGSNFGDLDNDGFLDFYLGTGYPNLRSLMPNVMYWNRGGTRFEDVTIAGGFGSLQKGHGVAFLDFDNDGDQDVFEQMGGALAGDSFVDALYENPGFGNAWIGIELVGNQSNRSAIGARIRATILDGGKQRTIYRHVNSGGSFGASPLRQTIGLSKATVVEELRIDWPTSNTTQVFRDVSVNCQYKISEGADHLEKQTSF